ncbi:alpha/beta hydrolase family esterase [Streptomyces sp. GS7]|uniref:alpha/beta hydrolase family esterase n=1 Tax=Streptomyces sp. GS7 TaxID=2692234 RepID=UPI001315C92E|nr:PHB depolymerase family esterase [Streptomyces sp. GS7]QHC22939.1 esterase [Streptomyces sp. GS7]
MVSEDEPVAGELTIGGRRRSFTIRLPRAVPDGRQVPLVLALHGNHPEAGGWMMREWTTFDKQADTWGFAVAYPDGHEGCWSDGRGVTTADEAGVDDVAFLRAIVDRSAARYGTSPDRTVVAGVSNGAFMAHRFALEASAQVAVLAAVAGGLPAALRELQPTHAVSAMLIHGTADGYSPIEGGYSRHRGPNGELRGRTLSLRETAERWRTVDRCPPGPGRTRTTAFSRRTSADGGVGGTRVVAWTVIGGGHTWPGVPAAPDLAEPSTQECDAAEEICRFAEPLLVPADARRL